MRGANERASIDQHMLNTHNATEEDENNKILDKNRINQSYDAMQLYWYNYYAASLQASNVPQEQIPGIIQNVSGICPDCSSLNKNN